ncbi:MAG: transporter [Methylophaga sp.]|nr:MAG: transporter [Methylophaga sp.]
MKISYVLIKAKKTICLLTLPFIFFSSISLYADEIGRLLSLDLAIDLAHRNDLWLVENKFRQDALLSKSVAVGTLPDPVVSLSLLNLPTDGFDYNQENMTQLRAGISQMFPRGETLTLQSKKLQLLSSQNPHLRADRKAQINVIVAKLWLDAFNAKESIRLIELDRDLFEQLLDISEVSYSTAYGGTQQQDVIRAQLELTRLDDRLTQLRQQQDVAQKNLSRWVGGQFVEQYIDLNLISTTEMIEIDSKRLPQIELKKADFLNMKNDRLLESLATYFVEHPSVLALESRVQASQTDIQLAQQKYKLQWGLNAAYSFRSDTPSGRSRADFVSFGINFDLPIFTENKQDKYVQAAISEAEAVKTQKWLLLRKMIAAFQSAKVQLNRLQQRSDLYQQDLLPKIHEQADAALTAYTNDEGDFAEVVRARIDVLDAEIEKLNIEVDKQKMVAQLNYYLVTSYDSIPQGDQ